MAVIILILSWLYLIDVPVSKAADADILWGRALSFAQQGQVDLAFINFRMLVDVYPDSRHTPKAQLDLGEYHYLQKSFSLATEEFGRFLHKYPRRPEAFIALSYLYKIAQLNGQKALAEDYRKQMISSQQTVFIFKGHKTMKYQSGFGHRYKVVFSIDKIEVHLDGQSLVTVGC